MRSDKNEVSSDLRAERVFARLRRDQELMVGIAAGDNDALEEIWKHYSRWLGSYLYRKGIKDSVLVQEHLCQIRHKLVCRAHKYDPQTLTTVGSWLVMILSNVVYQRYLKLRRLAGYRYNPDSEKYELTGESQEQEEDPQARLRRDQELMVGIAAGDSEALNEMWNTYEEQLAAHVRYKPGVEESQVADILQEVRQKIMEGAQEYDPQVSLVSTWSTMIANRVIHQRALAARGDASAAQN